MSKNAHLRLACQGPAATLADTRDSCGRIQQTARHEDSDRSAGLTLPLRRRTDNSYNGQGTPGDRVGLRRLVVPVAKRTCYADEDDHYQKGDDQDLCMDDDDLAIRAERVRQG